MHGDSGLATSEPSETKLGGLPINSKLTWVVKLALAVGIIAWLCTGRLSFQSLANVSLSPELALLAAMLLAAMMLPAVRWYWLLRIQNIDASLWQAFKLTWAGYLAATILPGAAGGDLAKSLLVVRRNPTSRLRSLSTVVVDRLIGILSLLVLGAVAAALFLRSGQFDGLTGHLAWSTAGLLAAAILAVALTVSFATHPLVARFVPANLLQSMRESHHLYVNSKLGLLGCFGISLLSSLLTALSLVAADRVLGGSVDWSAGLLAGPMVVLANCLPITPGGIGVAEATSSELFGGFGSANGAEMMLVTRLLMVLMSLPALLGLLGGNPARISPNPHLERRSDESPTVASGAEDLSKAA